MIEIAPSILSADFARLADALTLIEAGGAEMVHVDVMDGHFVANLTIGPPVVAALARETTLPLDCHLMINEPDRLLSAFLEAGAARIAVHQEACVHLQRAIATIRAGGALAGVALNPATGLTTLEELLPELDFVLIMSVNPGFSGQRFLPSSVPKIARLAEMIEGCASRATIEVDGGVSTETIAELRAAGAHSFVAGQAVFGAKDPALAIAELRAAAEATS